MKLLESHIVVPSGHVTVMGEDGGTTSLLLVSVFAVWIEKRANELGALSTH